MHRETHRERDIYIERERCIYTIQNKLRTNFENALTF